MQLRARDEKDRVIFAHQAKKQHNLYCLECGGVVRLRSGIHRQAHFFHIKPPANCRQSGKSMEHIQVQSYLKNLFGEDSSLEHPFPEVGRIADCVWHSQKLVFEVQCSSITQKEVAERNLDYASVGYRVVWILHDKLYNQSRLTAAELWLQNHPHYFTDMDADGKGSVYDQVVSMERGFRKILLKAVPVNLCEIYTAISLPLEGLLLERFVHWKMGFSGDWMHLFQKDDSREHILQLLPKASQETRKSMLLLMWERCVVMPYRILFDYFLEKACR